MRPLALFRVIIIIIIIIVVVLIVLLTNYCRGDPIKKNETDGARGTYVREIHILQEGKAL